MATILIIDHQQAFGDCLNGWLAESGHVGLRARNATEAINILSTQPVEVVMLAYPLDFAPVVFNGELIRSDAQLALSLKSLQDFKLIVISGATYEQMTLAFLGITVDAFFGKPIRI